MAHVRRRCKQTFISVGARQVPSCTRMRVNFAQNRPKRRRRGVAEVIDVDFIGRCRFSYF